MRVFPTILMMMFFLLGKVAAEDVPTLYIPDVRGGAGAGVTFSVYAQNLPEETTSIEWTVDLNLDGIDAASIRPGGALPLNSFVESLADEATPPAFHLRVSAPEGETLESGEIALISFEAPDRIVGRKPIKVTTAVATLMSGETRALVPMTETIAISWLYAPRQLFAFLAAIVALVFWLSTLAPLQGFFRYFPPLIWMYFVPMLCTTFGITPDASVVYSPLMSSIVLPAILLLLLIPSDIRGIAQLGMKAVLMMLFASAGIVIGAIVSFGVIHAMSPGSLPDESWKGVAALAGSWIGGGVNMTSVVESLDTPRSLLGPMIVVDTVLAYSWLGLLIALSAYQGRIDKAHGADTRVISALSATLQVEQESHARTPKTIDIALMLGLAFGLSQICVWLGGPINDFFLNTLGFEFLKPVINAFGWAILLITAVGLLLSMTPVRKLDYCGASSLGYAGLYLLLTTYGARANLSAVTEVPIFFLMGLIWLIIHIAILYIGLRVLKAPLFLAATSSMANIGGTASAPVVAAAYHSSMAPVGLLMAILGGILGTPLALFVVAFACRAIAGE